MKRIVNRVLSVFLVIVLTYMICVQTNLIAKRTAYSIKMQSELSNQTNQTSSDTYLYDAELRSDFISKTNELMELIKSAGMDKDENFLDSLSKLFTRFYNLIVQFISPATDSYDSEKLEADFIDIFNGFFALDTRLNNINPELTGELTNQGFVCSAISILWDFMTYYDEARVSKQTMADGVVRLVDIPYIDDSTNEHMLDIYYPEGTTSDLPVIIDIHGGGLMMGDKDSNRIYCSILAQKGYTVISVNYRLSPDVLYQDQIKDIIASYTWINQNAENYFGDLSKVYVTGDSAGGQLAYYTAIVDTSEKLQSLYGVSPSGLSIDALGLVSGMYDMKNGINSALMSCFFGFDYKNSPYYNYLQPEEVIDLGYMPPSYIVTSTKDFLHPAGVLLDKVLTEKDIKHQFRDWPVSINRSSGHITSVAYPELDESKATIEEMLNFFVANTK